MLDTRYMNYIDTPDRSLTQRMEALQKANRVRFARAQFKLDLKAGDKTRKDVFELLIEPPEDFETMKVFVLLLAVRGYGKTKANKILKKCEISPSKTVGGLSKRQRAVLAAAVV